MTLAIGAVASLGARAAIASSRRGASSSSPGASAVPSRRLAVPSQGRTTRCALTVRGSPGAIFAARDDAVRRTRTRAVAASDPEEPRTHAALDAAMVDGQDPSLSDKSAFDAGERARLSLGESLDLIPAVWRVVRRRWPRVIVAAGAMALATALLLSAPVLSSKLIEVLIGQRPESQFPKLLASITFIYVMEPVLTFFYVKNVCAVGEEVVARLREDLFRALLVQKVAFFDR